MLTQIIGSSKLKKTIKITAFAVFAALCFALPFYANASQTTKSIYTPLTYTHNSRFDESDIESGIDISVHNGDIDWAKLKQTQTKTIIVRVGCRGYGKSGTLLKDAAFDSNIASSLKNGFETGVYFYSQALNEAEAIEEANFVLKYIKDYNFTLPVYYDYEFATSSGRLDTAWRNGTLNKTKMTNNALAFCKTIENAGYKAGVYASKSFFEDNLDKSKLENNYAIWLAHYTTQTKYEGLYQMWQYSGGDVGNENNRGKVSGIDGYVDTNFVYYDTLEPLLGKGLEVADIKKQSFSGKPVKPSVQVLYNGKALTKGEDFYVSFENNNAVGTGTVNIIGVNDYAGVINTQKTFSIVPPKVTGLKFESRTESSITVSWDKSAYASRYYVQVYKNGSWVKAGTTKSTSFEITALDSAADYKIKVLAYEPVDGTYFYGYYCTPIEDSTFPAVPTELSQSATKPTSLKLNWKKQSGASYYRVYKYNVDAKKYELFKTVNGGENNYLSITNLTPNKKYTFKVRAYKQLSDGSVVYSARSEKFRAYTSSEAPAISSVKSASTKKISVSWKKVSSVSGYQVMWSTTSNFSSNYKSVYVTGTSTTLTTAQSNKTYYVKVRAYKTWDGKKIYSPWSKTLSVKTK